MILFIELCSAKESWASLSIESRKKYLSTVESIMTELEAQGVKIISWGFNNEDTPQRLAYDYFGVFHFPNKAMVLKYEQLFRDAGWYNFFSQKNVMGSSEKYSKVLEDLIKLS